ncbi:MAG: M20/M25/M40 family metallo-hydrolase [Planctomycetes bacterium]|nr:M20/M25/M40 family metallo-hydrolase [Planctomycetota bacterium]
MRPKFFHPGSFTALVCVGALAFAQPRQGEVAKLIALGQQENEVMQHLDHLVNRIGPRLTGSDNLQNACEWALAEFQSYGLSNCRLEKWGEFPVGFNRGPSSGHMLVPEERELHFGTNAWTAGTHSPTRGAALLAPTNAEELEKLRPQLKGAWILVPSSAGRGAARGGAAPEGDAKALRDALQKAYDEASIAGTIHATRNDLVLTGGSYRIAFDKLPKTPSINLLAADFKAVSDLLAAGTPVSLEFDIRNWFEKGPIELSNVIAEIPGSEKPDEVVIVGGHLDSWDGASGAVDNGTGVATTLEAARLLVKSGAKPKRTIRFMLWGGEEQGLLGSKGWIKEHPAELEKISAVLVHDGGTNYCAGINANPPMVKDFEAIFAPVVGLDPEMPFTVREVQGLSPGSSDHDSFLAANVPAFFWNQKGRANYTHAHHTQYDTFDQAIPEYERNSSIVIAVGALGIADLPQLLSRENLKAPRSNRGGGRRLLGVMLDEEMQIDELTEDGIAQKAGLLVGDKLLKIGDTAIADSGELREAMQGAPQKTTVTLQRKGKQLTLGIEFPPVTAGGGGGGGFGRRLGLRFGEGLAIEEVTADTPAAKAG